MAMYISGRYFAAGDPSQSPETLTDVYKNATPALRRRLAENTSTPEELLILLAYDTDPEVRSRLGGNRSVPLKILEMLCEDKDADVRLSLAEESALPPYLLKKLCEDSNPYVRNRAEATLEGITFEDQLKDEGFIHQPGNTAKLGELLITAKVLNENTLDQSLKVAGVEDIPLGRVLVKTNKVDAEIVVRALKLQSLVRKGKITLASAEEKLRRACQQKRSTTREMLA